MANKPVQKKNNEIRDLSDPEKARLAGAIWIHGSIDIEHHKPKPRSKEYFYPRIMLSMQNTLPYHYQEDMQGEVHPGKKGYFTLEIGTQDLVEKRLREILDFMSGIEKEQIIIALRVIEINKSKLSHAEKMQKLNRSTTIGLSFAIALKNG